MNAKTIILTVIVTLVILASLLAIAYITMPPVAYAVSTLFGGTPNQGYGPGSGRGMMGGGGMMGGNYNNQPPASSGSASSTSSIASSAASSSVSSAASSSVTSNAGSSRGLVAVSTDGKTIPPPADSNLPVNTAMQKVGDTNVTVALTPFPPASFQNGNFLITLTDAKGQAITDAKVSLDLTMPSMRMPSNKPNAQHVGDGKYTASGLWTMRGWWRIQVTIVRGGATQSAFFDVWL